MELYMRDDAVHMKKNKLFQEWWQCHSNLLLIRFPFFLSFFFLGRNLFYQFQLDLLGRHCCFMAIMVGNGLGSWLVYAKYTTGTSGWHLFDILLHTSETPTTCHCSLWLPQELPFFVCVCVLEVQCLLQEVRTESWSNGSRPIGKKELFLGGRGAERFHRVMWYSRRDPSLPTPLVHSWTREDQVDLQE